MACGRQVIIYLVALVLVNSAWGVPLSNPRQNNPAGREDAGVYSLGPDRLGATFDRGLAETFVNFSRICYCDDTSIRNWNCSTCKAMAPFELAFQSNETFEHVGAYVGYWPKRNMVLVVFRGSEYLINFIQDLTSYAVDAKYPECDAAAQNHSIDPQRKQHQQNPDHTRNKHTAHSEQELQDGAKCKVHSGFFDAWKDVRDAVLNATQEVMAGHPGAQVWVTGHSMGGAMAVFCALDIRIRLKVPFVGLYTFGQPRVGNLPFASFIAHTLPNALRIVHQVPPKPPSHALCPHPSPDRRVHV